MITINNDSKSQMWTITTTDKEGFHRQLHVSNKEIEELFEQWKKYNGNK